MQTTEQPILLRILSGPQIGAEIALPAEGCVLGRDDQDDVVLRGDGVAPHHARLTRSDAGVQVQAEGGEVATSAGLLPAGQAAMLADPVVIGLGEVQVGIGAPETDWQVLAAPARVPAERKPEPAGGANASTPVPVPTQREPARAEYADHGPAQGQGSAAVAGKGPWWQGRPLLFGAPLLALTAIGITLIGLSGGGSDSPPAPTPAETLAKARTLIAHSDCSKVAAHTRDGELALSGFCDRADHLSALTTALSGASLSFDNQVRVLARMRHQISETLTRLDGGDLSFRLGDDGVLKVQGFYAGNLPLEELKTDLRTDIAGVTRVELTVRTLADARQTLLKLLAASNLNGLLRVKASDGELVAKAVDGASITQAQWQTLAAAFAQASGGIPPLRADIDFAPASKANATVSAAAGAGTGRSPDDWHLTAIVMVGDQDSFAVLKNRGEIRVGDPVGDGYVLSEIHPEYVVLSSNGGKRILKLRDYH